MESASRPNSAVAAITSWTSLLIGLLCLAFVAWYIPTDRSGYVDTFREFNMQLPRSTEFMLAIPDVVFPVVAILCGLGMIAVQGFVRAKNTAAVFHILIIALSCVALVVYRESLAQPLSVLVRGLSR